MSLIPFRHWMTEDKTLKKLWRDEKRHFRFLLKDAVEA